MSNTRLATKSFNSLLACTSLQLETYHTKGNNIIWLAKALVQGVDALPPSKQQPPASALSFSQENGLSFQPWGLIRLHSLHN